MSRDFPLSSTILLISIILFVSFGDLFFTDSAYKMRADEILSPPSLQFYFGTDRLGRDLFLRIIEGGKISLLIGFASALVATFIGFMLGAIAGYMRGVVDRGFVILVDLFLTFPTFFLLLAMISFINASALVLIVVISITGWMSTARLIRSESFAIAAKPYIKILQIAKVQRGKIVLKYFAPLLAPIFFVSFTFGVGGAILAESALSFLGLGIVAPQMSWGTILSSGREVMDIAWWVSFFPGLMIFAVTLSLMNIASYLQTLSNQRDLNTQ